MKSQKNNHTYQAECADQQGVLRIVQSIPSPKAEPFKQWLAMTGSRRLDEMQAEPLEAER
ncbi:MAG: BRO family protein [Chloroflexota bacterium]